jgi:hypothetical protein
MGVPQLASKKNLNILFDVLLCGNLMWKVEE